MDPMNIVYFLLVSFCVGMAYRCVTRFHHVGLGMATMYMEKDTPDGAKYKKGSVVVVSRLSTSPAGKAGVREGDRIVSVDGHAMFFDSLARYKAWSVENSPKLGVPRLYVFEKLGTVTLTPVKIRTGIPVYWNPQQSKREIDTINYNQDLQHGLGFCYKTDQYFPTERVSDDAIRRLLG